MVDFKREVKSFKKKWTTKDSEFQSGDFIIIIGLTEYAEISKIRDDDIFNIWGMSHNNFEGFLYEIKVKKLDIISAFDIMRLETFEAIVKGTREQILKKTKDACIEMEARERCKDTYA